MDALAVAGTAFSLVSNAKKAVDILRDVSEAGSEAKFLSKLVSASLPPIAVAKALANRQEAVEVLGPALDLFSETLAECEHVLDRYSDEEEEESSAPTGTRSASLSSGSSEKWNKWFRKKKDGVSKRDLLVSICTRIQSAHQLLQLCLSSLNFKSPGFGLDKPFVFQPQVVSKAHDWLLEYEYGRVSQQTIAFGMLGRRSSSTIRQGHTQSVWEHLYYCRVNLIIEDGKKCSLQFPKLRQKLRRKGDALDSDNNTRRSNHAAAATASTSAVEEPLSDSDEEASDGTEEVVIDMGTRCFRYTKREMKGLDVLFLDDKFDIVYQIDSYLLHFERCGMVSAEMFESIVSLCKFKNSQHYLSQVISVDKAPDVVKMKEQLAEIGPYWEDDGGIEATAEEHKVYEHMAKISLK
jgi:hypothetical protein